MEENGKNEVLIKNNYRTIMDGIRNEAGTKDSLDTSQWWIKRRRKILKIAPVREKDVEAIWENAATKVRPEEVKRIDEEKSRDY